MVTVPSKLILCPDVFFRETLALPGSSLSLCFLISVRPITDLLAPVSARAVTLTEFLPVSLLHTSTCRVGFSTKFALLTRGQTEPVSLKGDNFLPCTIMCLM